MSVAYTITIIVIFIHADVVTEKQKAVPSKVKYLLPYLTQ
jgi:hypothetical protein